MPTATPSGEKPCKEVRTVSLQRQKIYGNSMVPDVTGMGARDAVFMLESRGLKVRLTGRGKVTLQSLPPGHHIRKGELCQLQLE
jgi:cell division protein FtsI (penicillin-binding protein 3)